MNGTHPNDSAIRRMAIPKMLLLADAIHLVLDTVTNGRVVYPNKITPCVPENCPSCLWRVS